MRSIIFLDTRNAILNGGSDALSRHDFYATKARNESEDSEVKAFIYSRESTQSTNLNELNEISLVHLSGGLINYILQAFRKLSRNSDGAISIVAGDPWISGISAIILRALLTLRKIECKVQIQLHADICDPAWVRTSAFNRIKRFIGLVVLPRADSIRFVSSTQMQLTCKSCDLSRQTIVVSPVYINLNKKNNSVRRKHPRSIALVGRIEKDRGIEFLPPLLRKLKKSISEDFDLLIIGEGSRERLLRDELALIPNLNRINFKGNMTQDELSHEWEKVGVLLNLAPSESYGRTLREAVSYGIPVWSLPSSGFNELRDRYKVSWIKELNLAKSSQELALELEVLFTSETSLRIRDGLEVDQEQNLATLVRSWL